LVSALACQCHSHVSEGPADAVVLVQHAQENSRVKAHMLHHVDLRRAPASSFESFSSGFEADLFSALDGDRDGSISRTEFAQAVSQLARLVATPNLTANSSLPAAASAYRGVGEHQDEVAQLSTEVQRTVAAPQGDECWISGYSKKNCCDLYWGTAGDENCWDGIFTYQRCCSPDHDVVSEAKRYIEDEGKLKSGEMEQRLAEQKQQFDEELKQKIDVLLQRTTQDVTLKSGSSEQHKKDKEAEARRKARERKKQAEEQQAAIDAEKKRKAEADANEKEAARLEMERKACPEGYRFVNGDVPGFDQFGHEDRLRKPKLELCARECSKMVDCRSFEWSPSKLQCNMNKVAEPKAAKYLDFTFCKRQA